MNFKPINSKPTETFNQLSPLPMLGSVQQLLQYIKTIQLSQQQYFQIYKLLFTNQKNYQIITDNYFNNLNSYNNIVTSSNYIKDKYKLPQFKINPDGKVIQDKTIVPQFVVQNTTLVYRPIFYSSDHVLKQFWSSSFYKYPQSNIKGSKLLQIISFINQNYTIKDDYNNSKFTLQVIQPPNTMYRYIDQSLYGWESVIPPKDFIQTQIDIDNDGVLNIYLQKQVSIFDKSKPYTKSIHSKQAVYPCVRNMQRAALQVRASNIKKILVSHNQTDQSLLHNMGGYISKSGVNQTKTPDYYNENSKYFKTVYDQKTLKNINAQYYRLQDKLGFYNSLILNQLVQDIRGVYTQSHQNSDSSVSTLYRNKTIEQQQDLVFNQSQLSNIYSLIYSQNSPNKEYGFMNQVGMYKVQCQIRLKTKHCDIHSTATSSKTKYNNPGSGFLESSDTMDYNMFQVLVYPFNGIQDIKELKSNQNIGVILPQNLYKAAFISPSYYYNNSAYSHDITINSLQTAVDIREQYNPCKNYHDLSNEEIYNDTQQIYYNHGGYKASNKILKPNKNHQQFNFMFNKYGQFLTYRTQHKRYYNHGGNSYKETFADYNITTENLNNGWVKVTTLINKKFQGNTILSFNLNETWNKLVTDHRYQIIKFQIRNIELSVIDNIHVHGDQIINDYSQDK